jgi:serine/threonine protein kinase
MRKREINDGDDKRPRPFFIGNRDQKGRKEFFIRSIIEHPLNKNEREIIRPGNILYAFRKQFLEDPFDDSTWPTPAFLTQLNEHGKYHTLVKDLLISVNEAFNNRYIVLDSMKVNPSISNPLLFSLTTLKNSSDTVTSLLQYVLYNREDLVMKVTPLFTISQATDRIVPFFAADDFTETQHDILTGYFLNELIYGYTNVLSIHFIIMVDWFPVIAAGHVVARHFVEKQHKDAFDNCYQVTIMEAGDVNLTSFIREGRQTSLRTYRMILWEIFNTLKVAHDTHRFRHNDLHFGNIMLQSVNHENSPLYNKDLYYKVVLPNGEEANWFKVPKEDTENHVIKIIDFGRSTMNVPMKREHVTSSTDGIRQHFHPKRISEDDVAHLRNDINLIAYGVLYEIGKTLPIDWPNEANDDFDELHEFLGDILPLYTLNETIELDWRLSNARDEITDDDEITTYNLVDAYKDARLKGLINQQVIYIQMTPEEHGTRLNEILDHQFFHPYKVVFKKNEYAKAEEIIKQREDSVVVSFPVSMEEVELLTINPPKNTILFESPLMGTDTTTKTTTTTNLKCEVCGNHSYNDFYETTNKDRLCSRVCYEFKYIYNLKTVFR